MAAGCIALVLYHYFPSSSATRKQHQTYSQDPQDCGDDLEADKDDESIPTSYHTAHDVALIPVPTPKLKPILKKTKPSPIDMTKRPTVEFDDSSATPGSSWWSNSWVGRVFRNISPRLRQTISPRLLPSPRSRHQIDFVAQGDYLDTLRSVTEDVELSATSDRSDKAPVRREPRMSSADSRAMQWLDEIEVKLEGFAFECRAFREISTDDEQRAERYSGLSDAIGMQLCKDLQEIRSTNPTVCSRLQMLLEKTTAMLRGLDRAYTLQLENNPIYGTSAEAVTRAPRLIPTLSTTLSICRQWMTVPTSTRQTERDDKTFALICGNLLFTAQYTDVLTELRDRDLHRLPTDLSKDALPILRVLAQILRSLDRSFAPDFKHSAITKLAIPSLKTIQAGLEQLRKRAIIFQSSACTEKTSGQRSRKPRRRSSTTTSPGSLRTPPRLRDSRLSPRRLEHPNVRMVDVPMVDIPVESPHLPSPEIQHELRIPGLKYSKHPKSTPKIQPAPKTRRWLKGSTCNHIDLDKYLQNYRDDPPEDLPQRWDDYQFVQPFYGPFQPAPWYTNNFLETVALKRHSHARLDDPPPWPEKRAEPARPPHPPQAPQATQPPRLPQPAVDDIDNDEL